MIASQIITLETNDKALPTLARPLSDRDTMPTDSNHVNNIALTQNN